MENNIIEELQQEIARLNTRCNYLERAAKVQYDKDRAELYRRFNHDIKDYCDNIIGVAYMVDNDEVREFIKKNANQIVEYAYKIFH